MSEPLDDEDDAEALVPRRDSLWDDPRVVPKHLPERMGADELLAWYSYHIRNPDIPLRLRLQMADRYADMLRMTGPAHVTQVLNHNATHLHASSSGPTTEEARQLVARLSERFRQLPSATAPLRELSSTSSIRPSTPTPTIDLRQTPSPSGKP